MKKYKNILLIVNLLAILVFVNYSALQNEKIRNEGSTIYVQIVKEDLKKPIMQGDAINLHYSIANGLFFDTLYKQGFVVVKLDSNSIATRVRFQQFTLPKASNEYIIAYTKKRMGVQVGPEQYFIQQGDEKKYAMAKYGCLKVDAAGRILFMGLYDDALKKID